MRSLKTISDLDHDYFWRKVRKPPVDLSSRKELCWLWTGANRGTGYGSIRVGKSILDAHVVSFLLANPTAVVPDGHVVMHSCDVKQCVRPSHLSVGTHSENMLQAAASVDCQARSLTEVKVNQLVNLYRGGMSRRGIAGEIGCSYETVKRVLQGRAYWYWSGIDRRQRNR